MSYIANFNPTPEAMNVFKRKYANKSVGELDKLKLLILVYCMNDHDDESTHTVYEKLIIDLMSISNEIENEVCLNVIKSYDDKKSFEFRGWEYSKECEWGYDEAVNYTLEKLIIYTKVAKTPNPFTNESDFEEKVMRVKNIIDDYCNSMREIHRHEVMDTFNDYREKYDVEL